MPDPGLATPDEPAASRPKDALRRRALAARRGLDETYRLHASDMICRRFVRHPVFHRARFVACYLPMPDEVNAWPVVERAWRMKKRVFVPVLGEKGRMTFTSLEPKTQLRTNSFGLLEPVRGATIEPSRLDVCATPLVAFDRSLNRIGMGGGYYDRAFHFFRGRSRCLPPRLIGLAFDCQEADRIPASRWDIRLFQVITESQRHL